MRTTPNQKQKSSRKGSVVVLSAVMMIFLVGLLAFGVDLGLAYISRAELQRSADAAAISAAYDLLDQQLENPFDPPSDTLARATAIDFARRNSVANGSPTVPDADIEIGFLASPSGSISSGVGTSNAVRVTVKKTQLVNGETPFFFAQVFGHTGIQQQKSSTAAFVSAFGGFAAPSDGGNLEILPFALDSDTWDALLNSETTDDWTWNADTETVEPGGDGIYEVNLFPQGTGSPGNRGTVDIGESGNSNADIKRQILDGVSPDDLEHHGGKLEFDECGKLELNGDTGISAAVKAQLETIKGEPRIIPIFQSVAGNGNNANYTITKFAGIRILEVKLTGKMSNKRVVIQPAAIRTRGGIPSPGGSSSYYIFSPVSIVQ